MKKQLLVLGLLATAALANAQAELTSWKLNTTGYLASYYTTSGGSTLFYYTDEADVQEICYDNDYVWISCTGMTTEMGPWTNPNTPTNQNHLYQISRNPTVPSTKTEVPYILSTGTLINGVPIYGLSDARSYSSTSNSNVSTGGDGNWWGEAYYTEGSTLDPMGAHPEQFGGFHTHALATPLWEDTPTSQHSPIIGWAWDGFPIYGPYGYSSAMNASSGVTRMTSSYQLRTMTDRTILADGSSSIPPGPSNFSTFPIGNYIQDYEYVNGLGTLDEYNGRNCVTPEFPSGTYAYFTTIDGAGDPVFPYYIGLEYYGAPITANNTNTVSTPTSCTQYTGVSGIDAVNVNALTVYPNPTEDVITIQSDVQIASLELYSIRGEKVLGTNNSNNINLESLAPGLYLIKATTSNGHVYTEKITKK